MSKRLVKDLKEDLFKQFGIPESTLRLIPDTCPYDSQPLESNLTFTEVSCSDVNCVGKRSQRLQGYLQAIGLKGYGEVFCFKFAKDVPIVIPHDVLLIEEGKLRNTRFEEYIEFIQDVKQVAKSVQQTAQQVLSSCGLPLISGNTISGKLFKGITSCFGSQNSVENFMDRFEQDPYEFIRFKLEIKTPYSKTVEEAAKVIKQFAPHLLRIFEVANEYFAVSMDEVQYEVKSTKKFSLNLLASDSVGGRFAKKKDFYDYIQKEFPHIEFNIQSSVTSKTHILVWDGGKVTSKAQKALDLKEKGLDIWIGDADTIIAKLKEL